MPKQSLDEIFGSLKNKNNHTEKKSLDDIFGDLGQTLPSEPLKSISELQPKQSQVPYAIGKEPQQEQQPFSKTSAFGESIQPANENTEEYKAAKNAQEFTGLMDIKKTHGNFQNIYNLPPVQQKEALKDISPEMQSKVLKIGENQTIHLELLTQMDDVAKRYPALKGKTDAQLKAVNSKAVQTAVSNFNEPEKKMYQMELQIKSLESKPDKSLSEIETLNTLKQQQYELGKPFYDYQTGKLINEQESKSTPENKQYNDVLSKKVDLYLLSSKEKLHKAFFDKYLLYQKMDKDNKYTEKWLNSKADFDAISKVYLLRQTPSDKENIFERISGKIAEGLVNEKNNLFPESIYGEKHTKESFNKRAPQILADYNIPLNEQQKEGLKKSFPMKVAETVAGIVPIIAYAPNLELGIGKAVESKMAEYVAENPTKVTKAIANIITGTAKVAEEEFKMQSVGMQPGVGGSFAAGEAVTKNLSAKAIKNPYLSTLANLAIQSATTTSTMELANIGSAGVKALTSDESFVDKVKEMYPNVDEVTQRLLANFVANGLVIGATHGGQLLSEGKKNAQGKTYGKFMDSLDKEDFTQKDISETQKNLSKLNEAIRPAEKLDGKAIQDDYTIHEPKYIIDGDQASAQETSDKINNATTINELNDIQIHNDPELEDAKQQQLNKIGGQDAIEKRNEQQDGGQEHIETGTRGVSTQAGDSNITEQGGEKQPATQTPEKVEEKITTKPEEKDGGVSDAEYNNFIDNGKVTDERLKNIAEKKRNHDELSEREMQIFNDKTKEVNNIIKESAPKETVESIQSEINNNNNLITKEQEKINKINQQKESETKQKSIELITKRIEELQNNIEGLRDKQNQLDTESTEKEPLKFTVEGIETAFETKNPNKPVKDTELDEKAKEILKDKPVDQFIDDLSKIFEIGGTPNKYQSRALRLSLYDLKNKDINLSLMIDKARDEGDELVLNRLNKQKEQLKQQSNILSEMYLNTMNDAGSILRTTQEISDLFDVEYSEPMMRKTIESLSTTGLSESDKEIIAEVSKNLSNFNERLSKIRAEHDLNLEQEREKWLPTFECA